MKGLEARDVALFGSENGRWMSSELWTGSRKFVSSNELPLWRLGEGWGNTRLRKNNFVTPERLGNLVLYCIGYSQFAQDRLKISTHCAILWLSIICLIFLGWWFHELFFIDCQAKVVDTARSQATLSILFLLLSSTTRPLSGYSPPCFTWRLELHFHLLISNRN